TMTAGATAGATASPTGAPEGESAPKRGARRVVIKTSPRGRNHNEGTKMKTLMQRLCGAAMIAATAIGFSANANAQGDQQVLVDQATTTLNNFMRDPGMKWLQQNIGRAKAVLIAPEIVKAGFIIGGSGGRAVLVAKNGGKWVGPAFYNLATVSIGFQA